MQMIQLTPEEQAAFRDRVSGAHVGQTFKTPVTWIDYEGGPLDGLRTPVETQALTCQFVGWCFVRHDGPVQALYAKGPSSERWMFDRYEGGPR